MTTTPFFHGTFTLKRKWAASPERIFEAWSDPAIKAQWFTGPPEQWTLGKRSMDFRVGGHELLDLVRHERRVESDGLLLLLPVVTGRRHGVARDREAGPADALAHHPRLAEREVVPRLRDEGQGARRAGRDVLDLSHDAQPVVGEQVELRHLRARVAHRERQGPARRGRRGHLARRVGRGDGECVGGRDVALRDAAGQHEGDGAECGDGAPGTHAGHDAPWWCGTGGITGDAAERAGRRRRPRTKRVPTTAR